MTFASNSSALLLFIIDLEQNSANVRKADPQKAFFIQYEWFSKKIMGSLGIQQSNTNV